MFFRGGKRIFSLATSVACLAITVPTSAQLQPDPVTSLEKAEQSGPVEREFRRLESWQEMLELLSKTPDYMTASAEIVRAQAEKRIALASVLPSVTGNLSYRHNFFSRTVTLGTGTTTSSPPGDIATASANASWSVINPRELYSVGTANRAIDAERLNFSERRREIAMSAVSAVLASRAAERVVELNRIALSAAEDRLKLTQAQLEFGGGTELDVDRALQDVATVRRNLIDDYEALKRSRENLGRVLGSEIPLVAGPVFDMAHLQDAVGKRCHSNASVAERPDVASAQVGIELAERSETEALLRISPWIDVVSQVSYDSAVVFGSKGLASVVALLTVPFYDGGARYGELRRARAEIEKARQFMRETYLDADVEVEQAKRAVYVVSESRDVAAEQRDLAARIDERTQKAYANGAGTSLDLVTSAQALRQAEISLALLDVRFAEARANAILVNADCKF